MRSWIILMLATILLCEPASAKVSHPDCAGPEQWPAAMAFTKLKNASLLTSAGTDFGHTESSRISSQKIGRDLLRQVHDVKFTTRKGDVVEALTVSEASASECSMSVVEVFVVKQRF